MNQPVTAPETTTYLEMQTRGELKPSAVDRNRLTLTRLGIGKFHIADHDTFDVVNFNRQAGATLDTIGRPKVDVMADMARAVNPDLDIVKFPDGVSASNLEAFIEGVDVYVDGLDFFAFDIREKTFAACYEKRIPAGVKTAEKT